MLYLCYFLSIWKQRKGGYSFCCLRGSDTTTDPFSGESQAPFWKTLLQTTVYIVLADWNEE